MAAAEIIGLILTGGKSTRMGEDKANLRYHEAPQALHLAGILEKLGVRPRISCRKGDTDRWQPYRAVEDTAEGTGPMAGLLAAHQQFPSSAILALACDYPLLRINDVRWLISQRSTKHQLTAVCLRDALGEPLLAVWEPSALCVLTEFFKSGNYKLMDVLAELAVHLAHPPDPQFFMQANDPAAKKRARDLLGHGGMRND